MGQLKILTIDDDPDILDVLELTLSDHFVVFQGSNGEEGLKLARAHAPDLIITDYKMPVMDGREFCKALKKDVFLQHTPVIMLTGKGEVKDKVSGLEAGADDYLVKPFEPNELLARINMILRRTKRSLDANPLTRLLGNNSIMDELQYRIQSGKPFAVGYADLDKFKAYNDIYGFEKGDEVIKKTAHILIQAVQKKGTPDTFVGHIGGDDFVYVCDDAIADDIAQEIVDQFNAIVVSLYTEEDRRRGYIIARNRQNEEAKFGFLSISIGIVSNLNQPIRHVAQVAEIGAELKRYAKGIEGSSFVRDKRKGS
ncbi:MAG TPA: response regulator [Candidatus Omnitrophota bacterium]|nr:response regulator [Candidatus Omnitrophota bacterium]